jgi:hypothetical protein
MPHSVGQGSLLTPPLMGISRPAFGGRACVGAELQAEMCNTQVRPASGREMAALWLICGLYLSFGRDKGPLHKLGWLCQSGQSCCDQQSS